jgi:Cd2+/Zn2+-exporting ATPase
MLSIPLGYFGGIGGASRQGILVKGASFLDALAEADTVVFDKTGTLTRGVFKVQGIDAKPGLSEDDVLSLAAHAEVHSSHPIAQSILEAFRDQGGEVDEPAVTEYEEIPGNGVQATVGGRRVVACSHRYLHSLGVDHHPCDEGETAVHVIVDGEHVGRIRVGDEIRADARASVEALRRGGVRRIGMLTGDVAPTADRVAEELGLDFHQAGLLPQGKIDAMESLIAERDAQGSRRRIAFVGDGVNDAPVLARADVGIAMGGLGSDAAIEAADVVVTADAVGRVPAAVGVSRNTRRIIWQNIVMALGIKAAVMVLGAAGMASMWAAVWADVGVTVAAVLNSTRILQIADEAPHSQEHEH